MDSAELKKLEDSLWAAADRLRANSKLNATAYSMPVLLLDNVKDELAKLDNWKEKRQTQAHVKQLIYDYLLDEKTGLPVDAYTPEEVKELAEVVYLHVYEQLGANTTPVPPTATGKPA